MKVIVSLLLLFPSLFNTAYAPAYTFQSDSELSEVRRLDREDSGAELTSEEHMRRGNVYLKNRAFAESRTHFQAVIERPQDPYLPSALYGMGRSYFQMRGYLESIPFFERVSRDYAQTKDGRDGLYWLASAYLRLGRADEAAARFREYTERYPAGDRIEFAYLNVADGLREAGRPQDAINWIDRTRQRFAGTPTATNALFTRLRLDITGRDWEHAIRTADELRSAAFSKKVFTNLNEVLYLKAYSLERAGRPGEAAGVYLSIPDGVDSYFGGLATERLMAINDPARRAEVAARAERVRGQIAAASRLYPAPFRESVLREAGRRKVDPRFVLAIMSIESGFKPRAKSPAAARGLLQLTPDTAAKYAAHVGLNNLRDEELYRPETNIMLGSEYMAELFRQFPNLPEAVAASYNGGEDNVARWLKRAGHRDPGVFTSEVGFEETKNYVNKVMATYRAYKQLYTSDLRARS